MTRTGASKADASGKAICIDVTRLVRRTGRVFTGVDRVEWAYLNWALASQNTVYGVMRSAFGYVLLDRRGLEVLRDRVRDASWPKPDLLSRFALKLSAQRRGAETALRSVAIARATPARLARMLRRAIREPFVYFNTGHSNLTHRMLGAIKSHEQAQSVVLIHDMIPLTHPQFQRPGTEDAFRAKMQTVSRHTPPPHLVICGGRGWNNEAVFAQLDAMKAKGAPVTELNGLPDAQMFALLRDAKSALFPSHAEGYGLPQLEAAQLGVPLICGDLDIYREVLGKLPVYVRTDDPYSWAQAITETLQADGDDRKRAEKPGSDGIVPKWDAHFNLVLKEFG